MRKIIAMLFYISDLGILYKRGEPMETKDFQAAFDVLVKMRLSLLESLVEELLNHQNDDASSFALQEIEDRFAIRITNLNTLIATMQEQIVNHPNFSTTRVVSKVHEIPRQKLQSQLDDLLAFVSPEDLLHLSVIPTTGGKYLIIMANGE